MKRLCAFLFALALILSLCACDTDTPGMNATATDENGEPVKISYVAEFYDNYGAQWLSVEGTSFNIEPNKVKEYAYNSNGTWESSWTTSSVMSITIDNQHIESCGSTVLFYDTRLTPLEIDIPKEITSSTGDSATIKTPYDGYSRSNDRWGLMYWYWQTEKQANSTPASRVVVIQSQNGDPICMFTGEEVTWSVSRNLPKTTELVIDGKVVYIHRSNFSIIDTSIFK